MNQQNNLWKFILVIGVLVWSAYEIYPPTSRDLAVEFKEKAVRQDDAFKGIVAELDKLEKDNPARTYANLYDAIGTNDIAHYFPFYDVKGELNQKRAVLNHLQARAPRGT